MSPGAGASRPTAEAAAQAVAEPAEDPLLAGLERPFTILVTGGSGFLGGHLLTRLVSRGHRARAVSRRGRPPEEAATPEVTWVAADVAEEGDVRGICEGCDVVVHLAGLHVAEREGDFHRVHVRGTANVLSEAARAGVERFLLVSALGADHGSHPWFRSKREAEDLVRRSPVESVVLRPSLVVGPDDHFASPLARWIRRLPVLPVPAAGEGVFRPVDVEDVADALCQSAERPDLAGRTVALVGPDRMTMGEVVLGVALATGRRRPLVPLPARLGPPLLRVARRWSGPSGVPVDALELMWRFRQLEPVRDGDAFRSVFRIEPIPFRQALEDYL